MKKYTYKTLTKKWAVPLILILLSILTGCAGMSPKAQIKLSIKQVEWTTDSTAFNEQAQNSLTQWINSLPIADVRLKLDSSTHYYSQLRAYLIKQGFTSEQLETFSEEISLPTNNIFIAGIVIKRSIPNCPSWVVPNMADSNVSQSSNFGCASQRNLAIMVADPSDLIRGKKLSPASAEYTTNALNRYYRRNVEQPEPETPAGPLTSPVITAQ
ncbi:CpaD family pilus assembly lipoprotein [Pseudomonas sp. HK3]